MRPPVRDLCIESGGHGRRCGFEILTSKIALKQTFLYEVERQQ